MKYIQSFFLVLWTHINRLTDHAWRYLTGLPLAKRSMITPQIYLGGQYGVRSLATLKKLGITAIVNMRMHPVKQDIKNMDVAILHLPTPDHHAPTMDSLKRGVAFIDQEIKKGGKVYIHCHWGEERGPTMVIAYLIATGMTFDDAYKLVKQTRSFINPRPVQITRLKEFEKSNGTQQSP